MDDGLITGSTLAGIFEAGFKAAIALIVGVGAWFAKGISKDVRDQRDELARFKLEAANTYAKDVNIQQSLSRLHDRLDNMADDIKTLIGRVK